METLAEIYEDYRSDALFDHLRKPDIVLVPGEGSPIPKLFIVGEAPGASENTHRRPFVGASGKVMRSLIQDSAELDPADWFLTNVLKYHPMGNRTPDFDEIDASVPYLRREHTAVGSPPVIVAVGQTARHALFSHLDNFGKFGGILSIAGRPFAVPNTKNSWVWPMVHPRYAITNHSYRPVMEESWVRLGQWFRKEFA